MKQFYFFILCIAISLASSANPLIKAISNGNWNNASTWSLNRLPQVNDTILIPVGKTVTVSNDQNLNGFVYLKLYGILNFQFNNSTLNLGSSSIVVVFTGGTIVGGGSASQKIRLGNQSIFDGNDLPILGPVLATNLTNGFQNYIETALPVKFMGFTAARSKNEVLIQWTTTEEVNASHYEIERSNDGSNWNTIATVAAKGSAASINQYRYADVNSASVTVYYRVKQVDVDGRSMFTAVKSVAKDKTNAGVSVAGVSGTVVLQFEKQVAGSVTVQLIDISGRISSTQTLNNPFGQVILPTGKKGHYIISLSNSDDLRVASQIVL